jgi:hypothetical protein
MFLRTKKAKEEARDAMAPRVESNESNRPSGGAVEPKDVSQVEVSSFLILKRLVRMETRFAL